MRFFLKSSFYLALIWLLLALGACGNNEDEYLEVDFSSTVDVQEQRSAEDEKPGLRAAVGAMISPRETFDSYRQILSYVSREMDMNLEFYQRKTYQEVNELLGEGEIDFAFICSGPYVRGRELQDFQLLVAPVVDGSSQYYSYLIVHEDSPYESLEDLRGKTFAFTDPDSNTGRMVPMYWLQQLDTSPEEFFEEIIYTYSHDNSILAVSKNLVDGAAVDHLIWEYLLKSGSTITDNTRVIKKSRPFGMPPVVASPYIDPDKAEKIKEIFLRMHESETGREILSSLMIERFAPARDDWYDSIREIHKELELCEIEDTAQP